jgi:hypothetical protein
MLNDFFRINMPYGMKRNEKGEWACFNREYLPLGTKDDFPKTMSEVNFIYTPYRYVTEEFLLSISYSINNLDRDEQGRIERIWFYNDRSNPMNFNSKANWTSYFNKIKKLSKLKRAEGLDLMILHNRFSNQSITKSPN